MFIKKSASLIIFAFIMIGAGPSPVPAKNMERWIETFQPSVLSKSEQRAEFEWFAKAAKPYKGLEIKSCSEGIPTHKWEAAVLAKAFTDITGIRVKVDIIGEGEVVNRMTRQMETGEKAYDIYVNDADLIGTHLRADSALNFNEFIRGEGSNVTNPRLDLDDFLNPEFGQDYEGNQLQIPDQQFANLYWFRYDWFTNPKYMKAFRKKYGYELGVPLNWQAYEDIAEFFTGKVIDGRKVYGHMDYGKKSAGLGWRFTDAWLSMAGAGDKGLPNGLPVDEWGIRVENKIPVGASVERGGATNGPAAVYAMEKYIEWMEKFAPPYGKYMDFFIAGIVPSKGRIAQSIFQYTTWLSEDEYTSPESLVTDDKGRPLWRVAPSPHGKYWEEGMKVGYQDTGSWTILKNSVKGDERKAAWLWAQFCISKSVCLKKFLVGKTPIRKSTIHSSHLDKLEGKFGGLITFYRSPVEKRWTDTGPNVPYYPTMSAQWAKNVGMAVAGEITSQQAMDNIAYAMDDLMEKMDLKQYSPRLNPKQSREYWLSRPGAPKPEKPEKPDQKGKTMPYDELIKKWKE
ncbi:MAG: carbohydrate ABC transporter substrate-binding protein [Desulfobacteraceae bacterium]|nr:carbohydrate ABC transporter substrate-binding protein [Desulfobacteraceae bacterium]